MLVRRCGILNPNVGASTPLPYPIELSLRILALASLFPERFTAYPNLANIAISILFFNNSACDEELLRAVFFTL